MNDLPPLPHLQFAVLGILRGRQQSGLDIRRELARLNVGKTGPAFYRLMSRMEESGLVEGWYEQDVVDGQIFRERVYRALPLGTRAWNQTRNFHLTVIRRFAGNKGAGAALA